MGNLPNGELTATAMPPTPPQGGTPAPELVLTAYSVIVRDSLANTNLQSGGVCFRTGAT